MPEFLKGNYKVDARIEDKADAADSTDEFEKKALSRLGGSICFVSKKSLMWQGEAQPQASRATPEQGEAQPAGEAAAAGEATTRTASRATPEQGEAQPAGEAAAAGEATTRTASRATPEKGDDKVKADGAGTKDSQRA